MPRIRYVGPIAGVDVVAAGLSDVQPGDEFDVDDEVAAHLLGDEPADDDIYQLVDATTPED